MFYFCQNQKETNLLKQKFSEIGVDITELYRIYLAQNSKYINQMDEERLYTNSKDIIAKELNAFFYNEQTQGQKDNTVKIEIKTLWK